MTEQATKLTQVCVAYNAAMDARAGDRRQWHWVANPQWMQELADDLKVHHSDDPEAPPENSLRSGYHVLLGHHIQLDDAEPYGPPRLVTQ